MKIKYTIGESPIDFNEWVKYISNELKKQYYEKRTQGVGIAICPRKS